MSKQLKANLLLVTVSFFWGSTFILVKQAVYKMPVYTFLASRFTLAFFILSLIFFKKLLKTDTRTVIYSLAISTATFSGYVLQTVGLKYTSASKSAFITGLTVVLVPIIVSFLTRKRPKFNIIFGVISAVFGLMLLTLNADYTINKGDVYTLLCAFCFAISIILIDRYTQIVDSINLAILQIGIIAAFSIIFCLMFETHKVEFTADIVTAVIITGIFATAYAFVVQNVVQKFTTPIHTALIFSLEPVFAAIFSYFVAKETFSLRNLLGCLLILAGMIFSEIDFCYIKNKRYLTKLE